jgi:DNA-binding IclR family transcriptional regulator
LSVPICGSSDEAVAAIGITGTTSEIHEDNLLTDSKLIQLSLHQKERDPLPHSW